MKQQIVYHGIIIKEGLKDENMLGSLPVIGKNIVDQWILLKVSIEDSKINEIINLVQRNLLTDEKNIPYYAHFYRENTLIIIFPEKRFDVTCEKESWTEAVKYGKEVGIPETQLDFFPNKFSEEDF